jgi:hypothetical protein
VICIAFGSSLESPSLIINAISFLVSFINLWEEQEGISKEAIDVWYKIIPWHHVQKCAKPEIIRKRTIFWKVMWCSLAEVYRRFEGMLCLHL